MIIPFLTSAQNNTILQKIMAANTTPPPVIENVATMSSAPKATSPFEQLVSFAQTKTSAQPDAMQMLNEPLSRQLTKPNAGKWTKGTIVATAKKPKSATRGTAIAPLGGYIAKDKGSKGEYHSAMELKQDETGAYTMQHVYGLEEGTVTITIDLAKGTVSIPAQKLYTNKTYGDVYVYPVNFTNTSYNPDGVITGTIDDKGIITLSSWGIFVAEGEYKGSCFNAFENSSWIPANSTVKSVNKDGESESYSALIEQTSANEIRIYNFAGNGVAVSASINSAKVVKISPQVLLSNAMYGDFYCYPADFAKGKVYMDKPITGSEANGTITFGNWVIAQRNNSASLLLANAKTEIATTLKISFPEAINVKFDGEGTAESPYLIKSAADLDMLSQAVSLGKSYIGHYFKLTQDIALNNTNGDYQPIGDDSAPFEGTFDGNGKTISKMALNRRGFSNSGVFGYIGIKGTVKNLNVAGATIKSTGSNVGIIAGSNYGSIINCHVTGSAITADSDVVGGITGYSVGTVSESSFSGTISNTGDTGGIVGYNIGTISKCWASAKLTISGYYSSTYHCIGGLAGASTSATGIECLIADSYFVGQILDPHGAGIAGGVAGTVIGGTVKRSFNVGAMYSAADNIDGTAIGGLFGMLHEATVSDCYNAGAVTKADPKNASVGGIVGYLSLTYLNSEPNATSTITNCYNSAFINAAATHAKSGLYGTTFELNGYQPADDMFTNCYSDSQTTGFDSSIAYNKTTDYFTSGKLPEGFSSSVWEAKANLYPVLKGISDNDAAKLSAASLLLANGETIRKVKSTITLNASDSSISWLLFDSKSNSFATSTDALAISGNKVTIKDIYSTETIVASTADGIGLKNYSLAVVPKIFDGEGTESSPYLIKSVADFKKLNDAVESNHQAHEGDFFKLTDDIDFTGSNFAGVSGKTTYAFGGVFDGDNHTIHGLDITSAKFDADGTATAEGSYYYAGLFGVCSEKSVIKNLNMAANNKFTFYGHSAPIVAYTAGKVINCRNYADVTGMYQYVAGVVGTSTPTATVSKCYNAGNILVGSSCAAGIVAYNYGVIELSQNDGNIDAKFVNALSKAGNQNTAGGIAAVNYGSIDRCVNNATISAYKTVGGLIGANSAQYKLGNVTNSVNNGIVNCMSDDANRGSIIGYLLGKNNVAGNYYDASVTTYGAASNASLNGVTGVSTSALTAGTALSGLSSDEWSFKTGEYPVLKAFENEVAGSALRKTYVAFADGESKSNVVKNVNLAKDAKLTWSLAQNKNFTIANNVLNVTVPTDLTVANDTLTAVYDGKYSKVYHLRSVPSILDGAGTVQSPFQIKSVEDMNKLADFMTSAAMEYDGYFFKLMNDIDYAGANLKILAMGSVNFQGNFDGNGKTISGFKYSDNTTKTGRYAGLFGNVGGNGVVHDLTLNGSFAGHSYIGGFAGKLYGTISNCINRGEVSAANGGYAGGIAGRTYEGSVIDNCSNEGTVTAKTTYSAGIAYQADKGSVITNCANKGTVTATTGYGAGIVATSGARIENCYNKGKITGKQYLAGIVSKGTATDSIINCYNVADITVSAANYAAGIVASEAANATGYIKDCYNTGKITAQGYLGGIAGAIGTGHTIINCYNTGAITGTKSTNTGGLFGTISGKAETYPTVVTDCWNNGEVNSVSGYTGGLCGNSSSIEMTDCYNLANVTVKATAKALGTGGLGGSLSGVITNCWNWGNVSSTSYGTGGLSGIGSGEIHGCANFGKVNGNGIGNNGNYGNAGGLWGYGAAKIYDSANYGVVSAKGNLSGINGGTFSGAIINNCYNAGRLENSSESDEMCGNIFCYSMSGDKDNVTVSNCYYDATVNAKKLENENLITALSTKNMFSAALGDNFDYHHAAYPTIPALAGNSIANVAAANIELINETDDLNNVTSSLYVASLEGVKVETSDNLEVADGIASPKAIGEAWVKYSAEKYGCQAEKEFKLVITKLTGISDVLDNGKVAETRTFYNLEGVEVVNPEAGQFYIVKTKYTDGTESVSKVLLKD